MKQFQLEPQKELHEKCWIFFFVWSSFGTPPWIPSEIIFCNSPGTFSAVSPIISLGFLQEFLLEFLMEFLVWFFHDLFWSASEAFVRIISGASYKISKQVPSGIPQEYFLGFIKELLPWFILDSFRCFSRNLLQDSSKSSLWYSSCSSFWDSSREKTWWNSHPSGHGA